MSSVYPGGLDSFPTNRSDSTVMATNQADDHNDYADAINKIEATLGVDPQGSFDTVVERLDATPSGGVVVRGPYSFTFATPDLENGVVIYTPTVGDLLLDAWIEVTTAFDGTAPFADIGTFVGATKGLWGQINNDMAFDLRTQSDGTIAGAGVLILAGAFGSQGEQSLSVGGIAIANSEPLVPARFTAANPLKLVVSQTGQQGGTPIGGAAGAANVYLITATPTLV